MKTLTALAAVALLLQPVSPSLFAASSEWPQFRGPNRDGKSSEKGLLARWPAEGPKLLWSAAGVGKGGSVIFADGMLYCYSEGGAVGLARPSPQKCEVASTFKAPQGDGPQLGALGEGPTAALPSPWHGAAVLRSIRPIEGFMAGE